ncbi:hypothetical protein BDE36_1062 [Arcticibacter tournemirensis]|uniref:Uncharacterized protein n=1 Tax=Arcticibacter tournemirensis TaxID=699437 RepID=A0A4Q0M8E3_9SPHI|nr:hypothetical protein [Arcticibacter tournemirensis]KAA8486815.1 hypothetical protein F1649_00970 [Arcticibacter tournemirensis]RXF69397.1 hypothetical protein EKH83_11985 [Arcticibacter tournemirensis]TQM49361.1 hypothetical protein BDE36_1062 [Arcticibacter tournemirensis]
MIKNLDLIKKNAPDTESKPFAIERIATGGRNLFNRKDLNFKNRYNWTDNNALPLDAETAKSSVFNRHQGEEVLSVINTIIDHNNFAKARSASKVEAMLLSLPQTDKTQDQVKDWVLRNWNKEMTLI